MKYSANAATITRVPALIILLYRADMSAPKCSLVNIRQRCTGDRSTPAYPEAKAKEIALMLCAPSSPQRMGNVLPTNPIVSPVRIPDRKGNIKSTGRMGMPLVEKKSAHVHYRSR